MIHGKARQAPHYSPRWPSSKTFASTKIVNSSGSSIPPVTSVFMMSRARSVEPPACTGGPWL